MAVKALLTSLLPCSSPHHCSLWRVHDWYCTQWAVHGSQSHIKVHSVLLYAHWQERSRQAKAHTHTHTVHVIHAIQHTMHSALWFQYGQDAHGPALCFSLAGHCEV